MNRFTHHRRFALVAAGIAGTGVLVTGVASAAASNPTGDGLSAVSTAALAGDGTSSGTTDTARGKLAQALKEIRTDLKAGKVSGEVTVDTKKGPQTIEFQRGAVSQSSADSFTVTNSSGGTQAWTVGPKMKVRDRGQRKADAGSTATSATVANGENVIVVGLKTDTTETARLVVVVPAKAAHAPKRSNGSGAPSTSTNPATSALQS